MSPGQQLLGNASGIVESLRSGEEIVKSSVAASTTGAVAAAVLRQPQASSAPRRDEAGTVNRRVSSDVLVTSTKHVTKPWKQERAAIERRGHSQTGEQGGELRLTHERLQQYAAAHARLTAPARPGPRSTAGSTFLRKITNLAALVPSPPQLQQQLGTLSSAGAVAGAAVVRTVSSAPMLSPAALAGARLALTTPGIPLPGMGAPTGARPASAQRPQSPRQLLHRLISFPQHPPPPLQQQQRQQGAPPPERAFGPRAADYPSRHASPRPALPSYGFGGGGGGADNWQAPQHSPHPPQNAKQWPNEPRPTSGRTQNGVWTQHMQVAMDSPLGSPAGHGYGLGQGCDGRDLLHSPGYTEAVATPPDAGEAVFSSPMGSPPRCRSPPLQPQSQHQPHSPRHQLQQHGTGPTGQIQQQQQQSQSTELLPHLASPQPHVQQLQSQLQPHPAADPLQDSSQLQHVAQDRRLRPWTPRGRRPQSSGPGAVRWTPQQQPHQGQQGPRGNWGGDVVVVGLRDVPPSQLPFARAVVEPESGFEFGQLRTAVGGGGGGGRSSDNGTHASWWQQGAGGDSEASYPMTAVTDRNAVGDDDMTPSEAAMWLSRMAELEAEVMEEREFRRKYEEELRMLAAATTAGGRGARPAGGAPMIWQTTGGRVVSGARAAAAAVMHHRAAGLRP